MAEQELRIDQAKNLLSPTLTAAQKQFEAFAQAQSELASKATEINRFWVDRGQSEARLASELTSKLAADIQEVIKAGTRLLPNGSTRTSGPGLTNQ